MAAKQTSVETESDDQPSGNKEYRAIDGIEKILALYAGIFQIF
jgi:hypothetical protein